MPRRDSEPRSRPRLIGRLLRAAVLAAAAGIAVLGGAAAQSPVQATIEVRIGFIGHKLPPPLLNEIDYIPEDEAVAGARVAIRDNNQTGTFTGQRYSLEEVFVEEGESPADAARKLADGGTKFLLANLAADELVAVADAVKDKGTVVFNVGAPDDRLRGADCRANVFHVAPSRAMLTDALAQYLAAKQWRNIFLIVGPNPADQAYGEAVRRSARKFGLKIAGDKPWTFGPLARARADTPQQRVEALALTRGTEYDIMVVADEAGDFGNYIPYRSWDAKLVSGTQGLTPTSWHPALDYWGSTQMQTRFIRSANRRMRPADYHAWTAVRVLGEVVTRTKSADPAAITKYMLGPDFQVAAFKGVPVTFRPWDQQLRQPILLAQPAAIVSVSPQEGFLHQRTPLDTLGFDQPESACKLTGARQ